jgi:hypothetical protein
LATGAINSINSPLGTLVELKQQLTESLIEELKGHAHDAVLKKN